MDNRIALNPQHSVVVEACAGSGKTWLLVSRVVRLLLAGVPPGEILAITFTRKAAQEMQARLHEWLHLLSTGDDDTAREFLRERGLDEIDNALLAKARSLYREMLLVQPGITINTFHGWFMQIIQRAPLNAGVPVGMQLLERTSAIREEAWLALADSLRLSPDGQTSRFMQWLFSQYGLHSTRSLLESFVNKRAEWWAYTQDRDDAVEWATEQLQIELDIDLDADPIADACDDVLLQTALLAFVKELATGTDAQCKNADKLQVAWGLADSHQRFTALSLAIYTQADEPRSFKPTKKQNAESFLLARDTLFDALQIVRDALAELDALRMNQAALHCGAALLKQYQEIKLRQQQMDFTDLEWQVCHMLNQSDCAEYMQYKLDSRYRHVLLDEFQDTNPLQWQILQSWFAASAAVDSRPTVFVVGDPKQSIYRFRRADARLFGEVREYLEREFGAYHLTQNETRRNSPAVLAVVNNLFSEHPDDFVDFDEHIAHQQALPGYVGVLPLATVEKAADTALSTGKLTLRNPLITPQVEAQDGAREIEAEQFAAHIADIVANWSVQDDEVVRRAEYRDIMVLVRKRLHLRVYEHALRARHIPFLTSRRGGLLDTLEAEDMQALLTFLITPFARIELAQTLRSPLFACSDEDLLLLAQCAHPESAHSPSSEEDTTELSSTDDDPFKMSERGGWWPRLKHIEENEAASPQLKRAYRLLNEWLQLADKLPVHDLLDRIYFEGDLVHRYVAALPVELHETVRANLQAFMEIALNVDAGRYPSLPRFLAELSELRTAENESPDEGKLGDVGNALRIYTVHEAKGLEAPIVWLLDNNDTQQKTDSYNVLLDWQPDVSSPEHFSLYSDKRGRGAKRAAYFAADEAYARREGMNLLYVAMTRAKQVLLISGNGEAMDNSWYGRIAQAAGQGSNPLRTMTGSVVSELEKSVIKVDAALLRPLPTGKRIARNTTQQQRGIWLHAVLQHLTSSLPLPQGEREHFEQQRDELQQHLAVFDEELEPLWQQAQQLISLPQLARYFDTQQYRSASNEMPYVNAKGELKRIDRLVEFDDEVWVLDYKLGDSEDASIYSAQMQEYREAMQAVYADKSVRCALLFAGGKLIEVS